jgi:2-polyprenyl-3-methyl-5-hydroxy-6-metoxy-1,4-benzoquinol methylase
MKIVKCSKCGFVFTNPQPSAKEIESLYPDSLHKRKRSRKLRKFVKKLYEKKRIRWVQVEARKTNKNPGNILDIGCSNGFFLELAKEKGLEIYGTEFGKKQINYLKRNVTKHAYASEKELIGKTKFDIITAFDVIEHLPNPEELIKNCSRLLKDNGILVILTVFIDSWCYNTFKNRWASFSDQHLFQFRQKDMNLLLKRNGLRAYKTITYNKSLLHLFFFIFQFFRKRKLSFADERILFIKKINKAKKAK